MNKMTITQARKYWKDLSYEDRDNLSFKDLTDLFGMMKYRDYVEVIALAMELQDTSDKAFSPAHAISTVYRRLRFCVSKGMKRKEAIEAMGESIFNHHRLAVKAPSPIMRMCNRIDQINAIDTESACYETRVINGLTIDGKVSNTYDGLHTVKSYGDGLATINANPEHSMNPDKPENMVMSEMTRRKAIKNARIVSEGIETGIAQDPDTDENGFISVDYHFARLAFYNGLTDKQLVAMANMRKVYASCKDNLQKSVAPKDYKSVQRIASGYGYEVPELLEGLARLDDHVDYQGFYQRQITDDQRNLFMRESQRPANVVNMVVYPHIEKAKQLVLQKAKRLVYLEKAMTAHIRYVNQNNGKAIESMGNIQYELVKGEIELDLAAANLRAM